MITSPPEALPHRRAATLRAAPRKLPSSSCTASPVDAHSDSERDVELLGRLLELRLKVDGRTDRLAGRREDDERLVAAHLAGSPSWASTSSSTMAANLFDRAAAASSPHPSV